jgi:hypoxanthine phosphoribosyltransferase
MDAIKIKDKDFAVSIPESKILCEVERLAAQISRDLEGKNPLFLGILNGSFMFAADLFRRITER